MNIYTPITITEEIEQRFKPTRLSVKELNGVKYLCKSTRRDFIKYTGSGSFWKSIVKKYGKKNVKTLWVSDWFYCPHHIQEFALMYSEYNQVVESDAWANLRPENGLDGGKTREISANKGKMIGVDKSGKTCLIDVDSPTVSSGVVVSVNKGTVGVINVTTGETSRISQSEYQSMSSNYKTYTSGKMSTLDDDGKIQFVDVDDPRVLSGELSHILKGTMTVKNSFGEYIKVSVNDARVISGELQPVQSKMVNIIDDFGNSFSVSVDDPKYISGEYKFSGGPKKGYKQKIVTCPHCGKSGGQSNMSRSHFDKCEFNQSTHHEVKSY
jgi:hypothetical protein